MAKLDAVHGLYHRTLGMDRNGRKPKFWLGSDEAEADRRIERLELLWSQVEAEWRNLPFTYTNWLGTETVTKPDRPLWDEITLGAARAIARGEITFALPRNTSWSPYRYTTRMTDMQRRFNAVHFVPEEEEVRFHEIGIEILKTQAQATIREGQDKLALVAGQAAGHTWHQALDAYIGYMSRLPDQTGWYRTQIKQTQRLKENHPDMLLAQVGMSRLEEMFDFWRHRPTIRGKRIAATTARNEIIQLNMVLKWLDRSDEFSWQKPRGLEDLKQTVKDADRDVQVIEPFTVEELTILWRFATPLVRLEMLLALNCGFKYAEIASLTLNEIKLNVPYPGIVRNNRPEGRGNWIMRKRRKTKVYGEWTLWPWTVGGIEWALENRKQPVKTPADFLLVTRSGRSLDAPTRGGNKSDKIYSSWQNLYRTIKREHGELRYLPFKCLEKTATDWIRVHHSWEAANLFVAHGQPVKQDAQLEAYSNKPFARLFAALDGLADHLRPAFEAVPSPWGSRKGKIAPKTRASASR